MIMAVAVLPGLSDALVNVVLKPAGKVMPETDKLPAPVEALEMIIVACAFVPRRMVPKLKLPLTEITFELPALAVCTAKARHAKATSAVVNDETRRFNSIIVLGVILISVTEA